MSKKQLFWARVDSVTAYSGGSIERESHCVIELAESVEAAKAQLHERFDPFTQQANKCAGVHRSVNYVLIKDPEEISKADRDEAIARFTRHKNTARRKADEALRVAKDAEDLALAMEASLILLQAGFTKRAFITMKMMGREFIATDGPMTVDVTAVLSHFHGKWPEVISAITEYFYLGCNAMVIIKSADDVNDAPAFWPVDNVWKKILGLKVDQ